MLRRPEIVWVYGIDGLVSWEDPPTHEFKAFGKIFEGPDEHCVGARSMFASPSRDQLHAHLGKTMHG